MTKRLDPYQLLHGPYHAPALRRGDRATCLFRDGDVIITWLERCPDFLAPVPAARLARRRFGVAGQ